MLKITFLNLVFFVLLTQYAYGDVTLSKASLEDLIEQGYLGAEMVEQKIVSGDIFKINETSMNKFVSEEVTSIDDVIALDKRVRNFSLSLIINHQKPDIEECCKC